MILNIIKGMTPIWVTLMVIWGIALFANIFIYFFLTDKEEDAPVFWLIEEDAPVFCLIGVPGLICILSLVFYIIAKVF